MSQVKTQPMAWGLKVALLLVIRHSCKLLIREQGIRLE